MEDSFAESIFFKALHDERGRIFSKMSTPIWELLNIIFFYNFVTTKLLDLFSLQSSFLWLKQAFAADWWKWKDAPAPSTPPATLMPRISIES